jgi:hypothetical protein
MMPGAWLPGPAASWRWRGLYLASVPFVVAALVLGVAEATSQVSGSGSGLASTGTVILSVNGPASHTCDFSGLLPGELPGSPQCSLAVSYSGSIDAFLSLTVAVSSAAGSGGRTLYDGTNTSGLTLRISDGHTSFTVPTGPGTTGGACPPGSTCWTAADDLAAWYSGSAPELAFANGDAATFTVTPDFPASAGAGYAGGTAAVTLTVSAVQAPANPLPASCTTASIGQPCPPSGSFTWS